MVDYKIFDKRALSQNERRKNQFIVELESKKNASSRSVFGNSGVNHVFSLFITPHSKYYLHHYHCQNARYVF